MRLRGRTYPVILPTWGDPRLQLAAVIVTLQVLGQAVLGFELSIAQILVSVATAAVLEVGLTLWRRNVIIWPASALLTGNGVAFILRVPGTRHGDWWSLHGAGLFAAVSAVGLLSKYVVRVGGRHLFNPSNIGLVLGLLVLGTRRANPQDLWWGRLSPGLALTLAVIVVGGLALGSRLRLLSVALAFWLTFAASVGLVAAGGHCMTARWHVGPVCGGSFWWVLVTSPEILVFLFFMITDPRTAPLGKVARVVYAVGVGVLAAVLIAPERTEFATKVAVLAALAAVCAGRPVLERLLPVAGSELDRLRTWVSRPFGSGAPLRRRIGSSLLASAGVCAGAGLLVAVGAPARPRPVGPAAAGHRPVVVLGPGAVPPVIIDPAVQGVDGSVSPHMARQMAEDLVADLEIEDEALARRAPGLAATAATGQALRTLDQQIAASRAGRAAVTPSHSFDHLTVVVRRDPANPQGGAQIALATIATNGERHTFVVVFDGAHYLIAAVDG